MALRAASGAGRALDAERAQRDALVDLDRVADRARLADHDARAMIDEEGFADLGARVDVDAGERMRVLRHDARQHRHALCVQLVRDAVGRDRLDRRVAEDDLLDAVRRRIALEGGEHVLREQRAQRGDLTQQRQRRRARPFRIAGRSGRAESLVAHRPANLLQEDFVGGVEVRGDGEAHAALVEQARGVVPQVHDGLQVVQRFDHLALVRQRRRAEAVDQTSGAIAVRNGGDDVLELARVLCAHRWAPPGRSAGRPTSECSSRK